MEEDDAVESHRYRDRKLTSKCSVPSSGYSQALLYELFEDDLTRELNKGLTGLRARLRTEILRRDLKKRRVCRSIKRVSFSYLNA